MSGNGDYLQDARTLLGKRAVDLQGQVIGEIVDLYEDTKTSLAMLAKVRLADSPEIRILPIANAVIVEDGMQAQVRREALQANPTLKSGKSVTVSPTRVRSIYEQYGVRLPKRLAKNMPRAVDVRRKRRGIVVFPGPYLERVLAGTVKPSLRNM
ncbi:hypothetical protein [Streptomyces sp. IBSBF 2806]|uniref:hypothetical protein n=1 Tax=Streptomyces sp. IBSBF 2806 TaxID=2903529 RepID=UPI002FDC4CF4